MALPKFSEFHKQKLINEAQTTDLAGLVKLMMRVISKAFGSKFYSCGLEEFDSTIHGKGTGIRIINNSNVQLRFNTDKGQKGNNVITSLDYWKSDNYDFENPSLVVKFSPELNIIRTVDKVIHDLKRNKTGKFSIDNDGSNLSEAEDTQTSTYEIFSGAFEKNSTEDKINKNVQIFNKTEKCDVERLLEDVNDLVFLSTFKYQASMLVAGGSGFCKKYSALPKVKELIGSNESEYAYFKGIKGTKELYSALILNREKLIIIEDSDSLFENEDTLHIIREAVKGGVKEISLISKDTLNVSTMSDVEYQELIKNFKAGNPIPSKAPFTGRIIFITNKVQKDFAFDLKSDCAFVDIGLHQEDLQKRIKTVLNKDNNGLEAEEINEIIDALTPDEEMPHIDFNYIINSYMRNGKKLNQRAVEVAIIFKKARLPNWENIAQDYSEK